MSSLVYVDSLSVVMISIALMVGGIVARFSKKYMAGDSNSTQYYIRLVGLVLSLLTLSIADNFFLFLGAWGSMNLFLSKLMVHRLTWKAAYKSGVLSFNSLAVGFYSLGLGLLILYGVTDSITISEVMAKTPTDMTFFSMGCLMVTVICQCSLWPMHKWLLSSLNSPTPVSAMMHAGVINGGGFLLLRFSPLYVKTPELLDALCVIGLISAILGTFWKLLQPNIKGMLACSTMGQMGFMVFQCGLGLFPSACAHLFFHGLFKAYLFLNSGSAAQEKRLDFKYPPSAISFLASLGVGLLTPLSFYLITLEPLNFQDTRTFLYFILGITGAQSALPFLRHLSLKNGVLSLSIPLLGGSLYGLLYILFETGLYPSVKLVPQALNVIHLVGAALLFLAWCGILFRDKFPKALYAKLYVLGLNHSQPSKKTVTPHRNDYSYL